MGGGGAIRAAAKVGIGAANCGFRTTISEHPVTTAARNASRPGSSSISTSSTDDSKANLYLESRTPGRAWSEFDDWEFAGSEEDDNVNRVVFGGAPSFVEAREATRELKEALERTYLSSPASTGRGDSYKAGHVYGYSDMSQTKPCVTSEKTLAPAPSQHAMQAFRFLSESSTAQNIVASIASDPNVWNAVLQNPHLQEFLESQKRNAGTRGSVTDHFFYQSSPKGSDGSSENGESGGLVDVLKDIKVTVVDIWSSLSDYFQTLFVGATAVYPDGDGSARVGFSDKALNGSFVGLATIAILVVVLKRND